MTSQAIKQPKTGNEIRKAFLEFYAQKSHKLIPSASLIPDDPTVLLTIAGMLPFKPVFLGLRKRPSPRATSSQKCIRTNDIENVGITARHHTFFEMLGNFSFGDYFKKEAIVWAWDLVTNIYQLKPENIIVSVFYKDQESKKIWKDTIGIDSDKIVELDEKDNFWSSGPTGPCGPCSELYYDFHPEKGTNNIDLEDGDRFIEFYNLVFMQYNRDSKGVISDLESKNIDTGMGLERMAQILQKKENNYETDLIFPIIEKAAKIANLNYFSCNERDKTSLKIIGDHTRAIIHLISDGVVSSNLGRGYILRRLIRRMVRHGRLIGIKDIFVSELASLGVQLMQDSYTELLDNKASIIREVDIEEMRFLETLDRGEKLLEEIITAGDQLISGSKAFELYDTYGFPLELTIEIAAENSIQVDLKGFEKEMQSQKDRAKAASQTIDLTLKGSIDRDIDLFDKTKFTGYRNLITNAYVIGLFVDSNAVQKAKEGDNVQIILNKTSFYAESGGQVGDNGLIISDNLEVVINNVIRKKDIYLHIGFIKAGELHLKQNVETIVDKSYRAKAESNHTATHLLQSALKTIVSKDVSQRGSLVGFNKLRFDFNAVKPVSKDQITQIENLINKWIMENHPIEVKTMAKNDALEAGALAMFGEKYDDVVRVIDVPGVSMELCGGTHVRHTSELRTFKIVSELGISSGIRRIEALSGQAVLDYFSERHLVINKLTDLLKSSPSKLFERVSGMQSELIKKNKELEKLKVEIARFKYSSLIKCTEKIGSFSILVNELNGLEANSLQSAALDLTEKLGSKSAVIIAGLPEKNHNLLFVVSFGSELIAKGFHAGKFINKIAKICSGGGGGKSNFAQAGAKDFTKLNEALVFAKKSLTDEIRNY